MSARLGWGSKGMANLNPIVAHLEVMDSHDQAVVIWFCNFIKECGIDTAKDLPSGKWLSDTLKERKRKMEIDQ